jgi:predicted DsbA family dithiol-disulfide isomerase
VSDTLRIDIWSDIACPWCFVGKRRLEKALAQWPSGAEIVYHSFELSPDTPVDFEGSEVDYLAKHKHISPSKAAAMLQQMTELAATEGLAYDFAALRHTNTRRLHEVLHLALAEGNQLDVAERLFRAYFEEGRNLGDDDELVAVAAEAGLAADEVRSALADRRYATAVDADIEQAQQLGINGVPFFVFNSRFAVSGAQTPEVFLQALQRASEPS